MVFAVARTVLDTDLEDLVLDHRPHGRLTADATKPAWNGYVLVCSGV